MVNGKTCVLVTGAAGYIGKALCAELIQSDRFYVIGIDKFKDRSVSVFEELSDSEYGQNFEWFLENLAKPSKSLSRMLIPFQNKVEVVIHLAARKSAEGAEYDPISTYLDNVSSFINVLEWCDSQAYVPIVLLASSMAVYGEGELFAADDKPNPKGVYAETKVVCENILKSWHKRVSEYRKTFAVSLRLANVIGVYGFRTVGSIRSGEDILAGKNLLPKILHNYQLGGLKQFGIFPAPETSEQVGQTKTCVREYVHISDVVSAFLAIIDTYCKKIQLEEYLDTYDVVNVGSGCSYTTRAICNLVNQSLVAMDLKPIDFQIMSEPRKGDCAKSAMLVDSAENEKYGWEAKHDLVEAVDSQVRYSLGVKLVNSRK